MTLWYECSIIKLNRLLKGTQVDQGAKGAQPQTTSLLKLQRCTDQDNAWALFIDRVAWPPSGRSCGAEHTLDEGVWMRPAHQGSSHVHIAHCILYHIIFCSICTTRGSSHVLIAHCILFHSIALPFLARATATCTLHVAYYSILLHCYFLAQQK